MKIAILDDEYYALENLRRKIEEIGGHQVVGAFEDSREFLGKIYELRPDVLFLDVEMPGENGFEVLERVMESGLAPYVVFVTAYSNYAALAFEINALDYIVKPVTDDRLAVTLERIQRMETMLGSGKLLQSEGRGQIEVRTEIEGRPDSVDRPVIQIQCFRSFSIKVQGEEFNVNWKTKKSEELLAYLICEKGEFVSKEKLAEELWPEADGEKAISSLHVAVYYLKLQEKLRQCKLPLEYQRGKMRLHLRETDCDLMRFEELVQVAEVGINGGSKGQIAAPAQIAAMEQAVELYRSGLFEDRYYSWIAKYQLRYELMVETMLPRLVEHFHQKGDMRKAAHYQERLAQLTE